MAEYLFNLFQLLVENIFGGVGLAILGMYGVLWIIMLLTRPGILFSVIWSSFYLIVFGTLYFGAPAFIIGIIVTTIILISVILRLTATEQ